MTTAINLAEAKSAAAGETVALVSDAGTPAISDPGALVVQAVRAAGLPVFAVPGASALVAAVSALRVSLDEARSYFPAYVEALERVRGQVVGAVRVVKPTVVMAALLTDFAPTVLVISLVLGAAAGIGQRAAWMKRTAGRRVQRVGHQLVKPRKNGSWHRARVWYGNAHVSDSCLRATTARATRDRAA